MKIKRWGLSVHPVGEKEEICLTGSQVIWILSASFNLTEDQFDLISNL